MDPGGSVGKESACNAGDLASIPGSERSPGEGKATHSSILAWRIPWTEEPSGYSTWGHKESAMTEWLTFSLSLSRLTETSSSTQLIQVRSTNFLIPNLMQILPKSCLELYIIMIIIVMIADIYWASIMWQVHYPIPRSSTVIIDI